MHDVSQTRMTMKTEKPEQPRVGKGVRTLLMVTVVAALFWIGSRFLGFLAVFIVPLVVVLFVIARTAYRELVLGKRRDRYVAGSASFGELQSQRPMKKFPWFPS